MEAEEEKESFLFTKIPESIYEEGFFKEEDLYEKPEGDFVVIMHKGPYGSVRDSLEKLMKQDGLLAEGPQQCRRCGTQLPPGGKTCPTCHYVNE